MSGTNKKPEVPRLVVGPGRISWPNILPPEETPDGPRYRMSLLLPPGSKDVAAILASCEDLCTQAWGKDKSKWPSTARKPDAVVRRAEEKPNYAGYEPGWHFFSCTSAEMPGIVNGMLEKVTDPKEIYGGRWAKVSVRPFIYTRMGIGISLGLSNIQLLKHDAVFGRTSPTQDFDVVAEEMSEEF